MADNNDGKSDQLLNDFNKMTKRAKRTLTLTIGIEAENILIESREEFKKIIPFIPSAEELEPFTRFLISTGQYLALYKVLRRHGYTSEDAGKLIYHLTDEIMSSYPRFLIKFLAPDIFSQDYIERVKEATKKSQIHPIGGYVFHYVIGTKDFDYGVDYSECGVHKFLFEMGAPELGPYICATDIISSKRLEWGLKRTMTIAEGGALCDFRFRKGMLTEVASGVIRSE